MRIKHSFTVFSVATILVLTVLVAVACRRSRVVPAVDAIPARPNYADATQWYVMERNAPVDVFYIVSTETGDYTLGGSPCHHADTYNDSIRPFLYGEMLGVDTLLCKNFNYYSPYYRQSTLQTFTSDSLVAERMPIALGDVRRAFAHYLAHYNSGRPFILAGFSQGALAVVDLVKHMDSAVYGRMVAAYVIGWHVTDTDLARTPFLRPAHDSADCGVTICYNSVRDNSCAIPMISRGNRMAINPVNWRTDATPARFVCPLSADTLTVALDTASLLLHVGGYTRTDYILPLIGREGNYHSLEIPLYQYSLRRNMALRAQRFLAAAGTPR